MDIAGNPNFLRFAVAENPNREHQGKFGIITVDDGNRVAPVGGQLFESAQQAEQAFRTALGKLIDGKVPGTWS